MHVQGAALCWALTCSGDRTKEKVPAVDKLDSTLDQLVSHQSDNSQE